MTNNEILVINMDDMEKKEQEKIKKNTTLIVRKDRKRVKDKKDIKAMNSK